MGKLRETFDKWKFGDRFITRSGKLAILLFKRGPYSARFVDAEGCLFDCDIFESTGEFSAYIRGGGFDIVDFYPEPANQFTQEHHAL